MVVSLFATDVDGENYVANTTTFQFTVPGGVQQDDIIEFWATTTSSTATTLTPSHSTGVLMASYVSGDAALQAQGWYYRVPSTIPTTISVTLAAARQGSLVWRILRGVDTTTALDATPVAFSNATPQTSIVVQSITTTTPDAFVCAAIHNGSGGDGVTLASGWTLDVDPTRRNGILVKKGTQAVAGASGSATFPWTSGAYTGRAVTMAWRAAGGGTPTPALVHNLTRPSTPSSFYVSSKTSNATSVRVKAATNSALTTGVVFGSAGTPDSDGYSRSDVTGLAANTHYYYAIEMTDTASGVTTTAKVGEAWTLPTPGVPCASWVIGFGSCHDLGNQGGTSTAYTNMFAHNPQMVWSLGDTPYADSLSTSQAVHRGFMETQLTGVSGWAAMNANYCTQYTKSDHDSSDNDSKTGAWTAPNRAATLQMFPQDGRPDPNGLYRYEVIGRVGVIHIDTRYFCTPSTKLGATQMAWLKARLLEPEPVKLLVQDGVWIDDRTPDPVDDTWQFFNAERLEIANAPRVGRLYGVSGDQHAISADDGSHNDWGGWPTVCAAPFRNNASHKTANPSTDWSNGIWPTTEGAVVNQHGVLTLLDDGTTVTIQFRGYDGSNVARVSMDTDFAIDVEADAVGITDSLTAAVTLPRTQGDPVGITDSAVSTLSRARTQDDGVGITDSVTTSFSTSVAAADPVGVTDATVLERALAAAEPVGIVDSVTRALSADRPDDDPTGITDVVTTELTAARTQGDPVGVTDSLVVELYGEGSASLADPVGITDAISLTRTSGQQVSDPVGITDEITVVMLRVRTVADFIDLTDAVSSTTGGGVEEASPVGIQDGVAVEVQAVRGPADPVGITDGIVVERSGGLALLEHVGITDAVTVTWDGYVPVPLPDVLTITLVPLEMNTITIVEE